jgi:hypothetical protein
MAPAVVIGRLASRVLAPDAETLLGMTLRVGDAVGRLPAAMDDCVADAMAQAGLAPDAVVAVRRLGLRVSLDAEASPADIAEAWRGAFARSLAATLRPGSASPADSSDPPDEVVFADRWAAEAALIVALAQGEPLPWWAEPLEAREPEAVFAGWIDRDAARAAHALTRLARAWPQVAGLIGARAAERLEARLRHRLRLALVATGMGEASASAAGAAIETDGEAIPATPQAAFFRLAERLARDPASAAWMAWPRAQATEAPARRAAPTTPSGGAGETAQAGDPVSTAEIAPARDIPLVWSAPAPEVSVVETFGAPDTAPDRQQAEVAAAGLLLLIRPLIALGLARDRSGPALARTLQDLGVLTLQRLFSPLPYAERRAAMERERPVLEVFCGRPAGEAPLVDRETLPDSDPLFEAMARAAPQGVEWAPGARRRLFGEVEPFADRPAFLALARVVLRPAQLAWTPWDAEAGWRLEDADIAIRRAGWDTDPGWIPWLGRSIRFRFGAP